MMRGTLGRIRTEELGGKNNLHTEHRGSEVDAGVK